MDGENLPTAKEFEEAKVAIEKSEFKILPQFDHWHDVDEFDDYTEFMACVAAKRAGRSARSASDTEATLNSYENAAKGLLFGIGAAALIEAVIGDARL